MKFPVELKNTWHKHGGRIVRIERITHSTEAPKGGRSQDSWFFVGDVVWLDGGTSKDLLIPSWAVVYDDETTKDEVMALHDAMSKYLNKHGTWCSSKTKHEGWYANERGKPNNKRSAA